MIINYFEYFQKVINFLCLLYIRSKCSKISDHLGSCAIFNFTAYILMILSTVASL